MSSKKQRHIRRPAAELSGQPTNNPPPARAGWIGHPAMLAAMLMLLVLAAYLPALNAGFIWDDDEYVTNNPMLTATNGLQKIWFSAHDQSQYFPLVYTTFRFERRLWGLNPLGFHLVNVLLHGLNAVLVWMVLRRLQVPVAWLAAAVFALHPVQVESVAWVSELKNIESLLFYLLALLAWLKAVNYSGRRQWLFYGLALSAYLLALCAKTTACTLPAAMLLVLWLQRSPVTGLRAIQLAPFLIVGFGMGLVTIWWEKHLGDFKDSFDLSFSFLQRCLIASRALWFYVGKLLWPVNLTICYPLWKINARDPLQYIPVVGCLVVAALTMAWHIKIGRRIIAGLLFFVAALSPLLGFIVEGAFHYTYVADHYQYSAAIGLMVVITAVLWRAFAKTSLWLPVQVALLLGLGCLTWRQCGIYHDRETLWRDNVAKNPDSWMGHLNLGQELFNQGQLDAALEQYRAAVALHPDGDQEQANLGTALMEKGLYAEAIQHLEAALAINPQMLAARNSLALTYARRGNDEQAVIHFRKALEIDPRSLGVMMNLGRVLQHAGRLDEAVKNYRQALELAPDRVDLLLPLGNLQLAQTNYGAAVDCYRRAIQVEPRNAGLHYNLGLVQGLQGHTNDELKELTETLRLSPDFTAAQQELLRINVNHQN